MARSNWLGLVGVAMGVGGALRVRQGADALRESRTESARLSIDALPSTRNPGESPDLIVLLPAYKAAGEVASAFDWFNDPRIDDDRAAYVVITTEREGVGGDTFHAASRIAAGHSRWSHLHSARQPYCKASQLNDAVEWSASRWPHASLRFVVYDIDGRPERLPLSDSTTTLPHIEQQVPLPARPAHESSSLIGRGHAAVQATRVFSTEYRRWSQSQRARGDRLLQGNPISPAFYCWGNGLVISAHALEVIGGFPVPVDDLEIGYEAMVQELTAGLRSELVWHTAYVDPREMARSLGFILNGDSPLGNARWTRATNAQRMRLVSAQITKVLFLVEPVMWATALVAKSGRRWTLLGVGTRYLAPALAASRSLAQFVDESSIAPELRAPVITEVVAAAAATPLIRLSAWLRGLWVNR